MAVGLDGLVEVVQPLGQLAQNLPLRRRLLVVDGLLAGLCHLRAPDGVDAQVLVEDHEEVVEPALAEPLVLELRVAGVGGVGLICVSFLSLGQWTAVELTSSLPDLTTSEATVCSGLSIELPSAWFSVPVPLVFFSEDSSSLELDSSVPFSGPFPFTPSFELEDWWMATVLVFLLPGLVVVF